MQIDWWTLGLQTINALVLIWLLARFLFRPIASMLAERKAAAAALMDEAAEAKAAAQALSERAQDRLTEIGAERTATLRAAADEAKAAKDALLTAAKAEVERLRSEALAEIEHVRKCERRADAERARQLAVDIARRLVARLPKTARVAGFIDGLVQAVAALPEQTRADFCHSGGAVLTAPEPLTAEEEAVCRAKLAKAFGRPLELAIHSDPGLLAGLELEDQHTSIRNSFRADLARIAAELSRQEKD
jgi:F-type H+-transporting ATPase subunit b